MNKVMLAGNLTRDPEVKETSSGKTVANLSLAVDPPGGNGSGGSGRGEGASPAAETIFVDVVFWERSAESAGQYLHKGSPVLVEGRLRMDSWEDRETGKTRRKLKVQGERLRFLSMGSGRSEGGGRSER